MDKEKVDKVLAKMEREGTIESRIDPETGEKAYRLTPKGKIQAELLLHRQN